MAKRYGLPYQGSKNQIAEEIIKFLPKGERLVDLFGGGGAITDCAMQSYKWDSFLYNEYSPLVARAFNMAMHGEFKDEIRWISREDFFKLKDTDPYVAFCFSFSNGLEDYAYSEGIEPWKKALHYARVFKDYSLLKEFGIVADSADRQSIKTHEREYKDKYINWFCRVNDLDREKAEKRIKEIKGRIREIEEEQRQYLLEALKKSGLTQAEVGRRLGTQMEGHYFGRSQFAFPTREHYEKMREFLPLEKSYEEVATLSNLEYYKLESLQSLQSLKRLQSLQSLQSLERLQSLESLQRLEITNDTYLNYTYHEGDIVYCDPPYENTDCGHYGGFNSEEFYQWVETRPYTVFFSTYEMPKLNARFFKCWEQDKRVLSGGANSLVKRECIYTNNANTRKSLIPIQLDLFSEV